MSNTDLLLDLCDGIYLARVQGNLKAEWELYHEPWQHSGETWRTTCGCTYRLLFFPEELIRIYRSPELLAHVADQKGRAKLCLILSPAALMTLMSAYDFFHARPQITTKQPSLRNFPKRGHAGRRNQITPTVPSLQSVPSLDSMQASSRWQLVARQLRRLLRSCWILNLFVFASARCGPGTCVGRTAADMTWSEELSLKQLHAHLNFRRWLPKCFMAAL